MKTKSIKLKGIGLDLRNPHQILLTPIEGQDRSKNGGKILDYVLLDLLEGKDWYTKDLVDHAVVNTVTILGYIDMNKLEDGKKFESVITLVNSWTSRNPLRAINPISILFLSGIPENEEVPENFKKELTNVLNIGLCTSGVVGEGKKELENWKDKFKKYPEYLARPISPLQFDLELENIIKVQGITTFGLNWNGGDLSKELEYSIFTRSYLLRFAAYHSDAVLLSTHTGFSTELSNDLEFIGELKFGMIREDEEPKFQIKKSVSRLVKPAKRMIYESLSILDSKVDKIPNNNYSTINSPNPEHVTYSFYSGVRCLDLTSTLIEGDKCEQELKDIIQVNTEKIGCLELKWKLGVISALKYLHDKFSSEDRWEITVDSLGDYAIEIYLTQYKKTNWITKHLEPKVEDSKMLIIALDGELKNFETHFITDLVISLP